MPVLRQRIEVGARPQMAGAAPVGAHGADLLRQNAQTLARKAADYASAMAVEAEDTAKALAKAATFATGPNGLPQLPPDPTKKMGEIARRTYDATIQDRFSHQMATSIRAAINEAHQENLYDLDAFSAAAQERLNGMAQDIPPGYEGMFQQISTGMMVDTGASIGFRQAQLEMDNARSRQPVMENDAVSSISQAYMAGDTEGAQAMMQHELDRIDATPTHIMNDGEKAAARDRLFFDIGVRRLIAENDLQNASPAELSDMYQQLVSGVDADGNPSKALDYFKRPGMDAPDMEAAKRAANTVAQLMGEANRRATATAEGYKTAVNERDVRRGYAEDTPKNRGVMDTVAAKSWPNEDGSTGLRDETGALRLPNPEDWLTANGEQRAQLVQMVKQSGIVPESMKKMFRRLERGNDPNAMAQAFMVWRDLKEAHPINGNAVDMSEAVGGKRLLAIFGLMSDLHGDGDLFQEDVVDAMSMVDALDGQPWTDKDLANVLNGNRGVFSKIFGSGIITEENARESLRSFVSSEVIGSDTEASAKERDMATNLVETYLRLGKPLENAVGFAKLSMDGRFTDTEFMGNVKRSDYAPEKYFPAPGDLSMKEFFMSWEGILKERGVPTENIYGEFGFINNALGMQSWVTGVDQLTFASPFEILADTGIRQMLKSQGLDSTDFDMGYGLMNGGDYSLAFDSFGADGLPRYKVFMNTPTGHRLPLDGVLDISENWKKLSAARNFVQAYDDARKDRKADAEFAKAFEESVPDLSGWFYGDFKP